MDKEEEARVEAEARGEVVPGAIIEEGADPEAGDAAETPVKQPEETAIDPAFKDRGKERDGFDPFYDSTDSMYFGDSEAEHEANARKRARSNGCVTCTYLLVQSVWFNFAIFLLILGNTLSLALYSFDQSDMKTEMLSWCNELFTWAFFLEMVLKLIGLGPKNYVGDVWNKFDAVVVTISLVDWTISRALPPELIGSFGDALNAFRAMRLLRVLKLARLWGALAKILSQTLASMKSLTYYAALLFLFMFIFALLGMELFAMKCKYDADDELIKGPDAI